MRRQVGNFSQAFSQSGGRSTFPAFLSISLKLKTARPGHRIEEATGGGRQVGGPDAAVIPARSGLGSGLIEREAVDLERPCFSPRLLRIISGISSNGEDDMSRWYVTRPFKATYPGKPAMFEAVREKLGVGGRFTCWGTNDRQTAPVRTYEITGYGFNWVEETEPRKRARAQKERRSKGRAKQAADAPAGRPGRFG